MYRSLLDHVGNGKAWSLSRKVGGMFILPGSVYGIKNQHGKFLLRDVIHNQAYLERSRRDIVVLTASSKIYNIDFREVAEQHEKMCIRDRRHPDRERHLEGHWRRYCP